MTPYDLSLRIGQNLQFSSSVSPWQSWAHLAQLSYIQSAKHWEALANASDSKLSLDQIITSFDTGSSKCKKNSVNTCDQRSAFNWTYHLKVCQPLVNHSLHWGYLDLIVMPYKIIRISLRTMRGSSLSKRVTGIHLCIKRRDGWWMWLHKGPTTLR